MAFKDRRHRSMYLQQIIRDPSLTDSASAIPGNAELCSNAAQ